jgi:SAM-dependent methyltransferase/uncharacterized protein YbaR (Trm112 family)
MHRVPLACPIDRFRLEPESDCLLTCALGHNYPVVDGVPVLLRDDVQQTIPLAWASIARAKNEPEAVDLRNPNLFLESLGVSDAEKDLACELARTGTNRIDPVVAVIVAATGGYSYKHPIGKLDTYPIPDLPLPSGDGRTLLDIGCNWGRWCVSAAWKGYRVVGIDPSLGAIMAARRVARALNVDIEYLVADARYLPFMDGSFDTIFSYSVIQHFSKSDAIRAISEVGRVLKPSGNCLIQMAHAFGVRSLWHQFCRRFRKASHFEVRYWTIPELRRVFHKHIGPSEISAHCYFGLGLERADLNLMPRRLARIVLLSEYIRMLSARMPPFKYFADSLYISAVKVTG